MNRPLRTYTQLFSTGAAAPKISTQTAGGVTADVITLGDYDHEVQLHLEREHTVALHAALSELLAPTARTDPDTLQAVPPEIEAS